MFPRLLPSTISHSLSLTSICGSLYILPLAVVNGLLPASLISCRMCCCIHCVKTWPTNFAWMEWLLVSKCWIYCQRLILCLSPLTWVDFPKCSVPFPGQSPWPVISHGLLHDVTFYLVRFCFSAGSHTFTCELLPAVGTAQAFGLGLHYFNCVIHIAAGNNPVLARKWKS